MSQKPEKPTIPPIEFDAGGPNQDIQQANLDAVLPSPGFANMAILLADAITKRTDIVLLDYTQQNVNIRYKVDGVWHSMNPMDRESGDYMLATIKRLANLNHLERVQKQTGEFVATYLKSKHPCRIQSQGVASGERVAIYIDRKQPIPETLKEMGMRDSLYQKVAAVMNRDRAMLLASSMPDDFAGCYWTSIQSAADRFMRDIYSVVDVQKPVDDVVNVTQVKFDSSRGEALESVIHQLLLREPNVVTLPDIPNGKAVDVMSDIVLNHDLCVAGRVYARDVFDAILRVLVLKPDASRLAQALNLVVAQRTVRLLCDYCRQPFQPSSQLLQQLGLPPGRVRTLYTHFQPRPEDMVDERGNPIDWEPCPKCGGPGYYQRTSIFEVLEVTDRIRDVIRNKPTRQRLVAAAEESDHVSMREQGIVRVAKGLTSLEELRRVLKQ